MNGAIQGLDFHSQKFLETNVGVEIRIAHSKRRSVNQMCMMGASAISCNCVHFFVTQMFDHSCGAKCVMVCSIWINFLVYNFSQKLQSKFKKTKVVGVYICLCFKFKLHYEDRPV